MPKGKASRNAGRMILSLVALPADGPAAGRRSALGREPRRRRHRSRNGLHVRFELVHLLVTARRFLLQRVQHHFVQPHVNLNLFRRAAANLPSGSSPVSIS